MSDQPAFAPVPPELDFPRYERAILDLWRERKIFEKSLEQGDPGAPPFVFYEGPPTANGVPHNGHVLTRVMKDLFPRYHAMNGSRVLRKAGWDTHGLPVETEVEKELRIHGKEAIQAYGVEPFVARCIESVFRYTEEWESLTERIGFWVSLPDAYVTFHKSYVESVWWALSRLFDKGLLYQGHKVVWWWAQGGTALSAAEVGQGYKTVDDPSVYVTLPLRDDPTVALVVWTTTPWTLSSNAYAAVRADVEYAEVRVGEPLEPTGGKKGKKGASDEAARPAPALTAERLILAAALVPSLEQKLGRRLEVVGTRSGASLVGLRYLPPFDTYSATLADATVPLKDGGAEAMWWRVIAEDFVTLDTGTGIVHIAPAFGEDDGRAHMKQLARYAAPEAVELLCAVESDGTFKQGSGPWAGRWVKDCDKEIVHELGVRHLLVHTETYRHDYPFCWRAEDDPLIQMARPAWFIRTTARIEDAKRNNLSVRWLPEHIQTGRFGDFLDHNVDWALSRERFWGTPLNVWQCERCGRQEAPASCAELERKNPHAFDHWHAAKAADPGLSDHLQVHKPWIDHVVYDCPACAAAGHAALMRRVPEVIDCWFDSGCMPFAQWGFPHEPGSRERFDAAFPADFISEAIDQTRGWFYSLLMVSTLVFDEEAQRELGLSSARGYPHPYKSCIVLGHVSDRDGKKESKSKGNYTPPSIILDRVRMDFAVLDGAPGVAAEPGVALIAREDLEGMDLEDDAEVAVYRPDGAPEQPKALRLRLRASKKLPRRVVVLSDEARAALGVTPVASGLDTKPREVPDKPITERVSIEDLATPAPGADAFRWFFYASSPPWNNTRHSLKNVRLLQKDFLVKLRNVYSFFVIYANIDQWTPARLTDARPVAERALLDRWLASELSLTVSGVRRALDGFDAFAAAGRLVDAVEGLSNWYVRRSRDRFWAPGKGGAMTADKLDAYATLYDALVTIGRLMAPFAPFFAEELYQNLVLRAAAPGARESVHIDRYPVADEAAVAPELSAEMALVRGIVSLGLSVRTSGRLKVRQPLARADVVLNDGAMKERLQAYAEVIASELNVHEVRFMHQAHDDGAVAFRLKPNFRALGPRLGKDVQAVKVALDAADGGALFAELSRRGKLTLTVSGEAMEFSPEEIQVSVEATEGFAAETGPVGVVVLHTKLTDALVDEGLLREIMSRVQAARKDARLEFTDRIVLEVDGSERLLRVARAGEAELAAECLAAELRFAPLSDASDVRTAELGDDALRFRVTRA